MSRALWWIGATLEADGAPGADRPAIAWRGGWITRGEVRRRVEATARALAARTPDPGRIAVDLPNGPEVLVLVLAAARAGRAALVLDPAWPEATFRRVVEATRPDLIVSARAGFGGALPAAVDGDLPPPPDGGAIFYVCFTAGSTGVPKGCARSHDSWLASFDRSGAVSGVGRGDRVLTLGSFAHSIHLYATLEALHHGAEIAFLAGSFRPAEAIALARARASTLLYATPAHYRMLADAALRREVAPLPAVRRLVTGGAKWRDGLPEGLRRLFPNADLVEFYGASEMSFVTAARPGDATPAGAVGFAVDGVDVEIRRGDGSVAAPGENGEIWVRSPMLFSGYVCGDDPETRRDGDWLTIGDQGHLAHEGALFLAGRRKRMIVSAARNVFAEEVEAVLRDLAGVADAAVFGLADPLRGESIVAAILPEDGAVDVTEPALRAGCRARLEDYKVPRRFVRLDAWPLSTAGKPDLAQIRARVAARLGAP